MVNWEYNKALWGLFVLYLNPGFFTWITISCSTWETAELSFVLSYEPTIKGRIITLP